jgi:hypothetical protein
MPLSVSMIACVVVVLDAAMFSWRQLRSQNQSIQGRCLSRALCARGKSRGFGCSSLDICAESVLMPSLPSVSRIHPPEVLRHTQMIRSRYLDTPCTLAEAGERSHFCA